MVHEWSIVIYHAHQKWNFFNKKWIRISDVTLAYVSSAAILKCTYSRSDFSILIGRFPLLLILFSLPHIRDSKVF